MNRSRVLPMLAILTVPFAIPASAQVRDWDVPPGGLARNEAECHGQFQRADLNGDGVLGRREISEARQLLPTRLSGEDQIVTRQDFLLACSESVRSNPGG